MKATVQNVPSSLHKHGPGDRKVERAPQCSEILAGWCTQTFIFYVLLFLVGANSNIEGRIQVYSLPKKVLVFPFPRRMLDLQNLAAIQRDTNLIHRVVENGCFAQLLKKARFVFMENPKIVKQASSNSKKQKSYNDSVQHVVVWGSLPLFVTASERTTMRRGLQR